MHTASLIVVIVCFVWAGFMAAISFMESWLKFRAEGVDLSAALRIGRLIFKVLNRIEWCFLVILWLGYAVAAPSVLSAAALSYVILTGILLVQTAWLLPALDRRAVATISGTQGSRSSLHIWFVGLELVKLIVLMNAGVHVLLS